MKADVIIFVLKPSPQTDDDDDNRIILKTCHTVAPRLT